MSDVAALRHFNRSFTQRIGVLQDRFLGRGRPLGLSRLLFEIGLEGASVAELRRRLDLDAGYVSRMLRGLGREGLVELLPDPADRRRRRARLTGAGRREWYELERRADRLAEELLARLTAGQRTQLREAMDLVAQLLRAATVTFELVDPAARPARWAVAQYFQELDQVFPTEFVATGAAADERPMTLPDGAFVVMWCGGEVVGCGGVTTLAAGVGEIRRMWIARGMRGLGLGRRLLGVLEEHSQRLGHDVVRLYTNSSLATAISMYERAGYRDIERYTRDPYAQRWFEKDLSLEQRGGVHHLT